jgi:hypothetical protein
VRLRLLAVAALLATGRAGASEPPKPAFPGLDAVVVVNRTNGKLAASAGGKLLVFERFGATTPILQFDIPGIGGSLREFAGNNLVYGTTGINDQPRTMVAITDGGMERLAWPNDGLFERFPGETSHLTLDGKGLYDRLTLDEDVRRYFELDDDIPLGAGVVATFRFSGEKMAARASDGFGPVLALSPDDMLISAKTGGLLHYRAGKGVVWKLDEGTLGETRALDAAAGVALLLDGAGTLLAVDVEKGEVRWRWTPVGREKELALWSGEAVPTPTPVPAPRVDRSNSGVTPAATPAASPTPGPRVLPWRVVDARLLSDGHVLLLMRGSRPGLGLLDGAGGALIGGEMLATLESRGLDAVATLWRDRGCYLAWVQETPSPAGPALLLKGSDGWYAAPLPAR